jgi:hypothetical protein
LVDADKGIRDGDVASTAVAEGIRDEDVAFTADEAALVDAASTPHGVLRMGIRDEDVASTDEAVGMGIRDGDVASTDEAVGMRGCDEDVASTSADKGGRDEDVAATSADKGGRDEDVAFTADAVALVAAASPPQIVAWITFVRSAIIPASSSCATSYPPWQGKIHLVVRGVWP